MNTCQNTGRSGAKVTYEIQIAIGLDSKKKKAIFETLCGSLMLINFALKNLANG
jgi:hypothetical protein